MHFFEQPPVREDGWLYFFLTAENTKSAETFSCPVVCFVVHHPYRKFFCVFCG